MNTIKTAMLLAMLTALFMVLGLFLGGQGGMVIALMIAIGMNIFTYWNADKIVLRMHRAIEVDAQSHPKFYAIVADLARRANIPMPKTYLVEESNPNAFATGRDPEHAAVAVTTGLIAMLTHDELEGVIAHEIAHIRGRDTLIMTMVATIAGAVSMLANFGLWFRAGDSRSAGLAGLVAVLVAPFAAMIVQMAISRTREYEADRVGAAIAGSPRGLASALTKISEPAVSIPNRTAHDNPAAAALYIAPLSLGGLFSTHPPTQDRVAALMRAEADFPSLQPGNATGRKNISALDPNRRG